MQIWPMTFRIWKKWVNADFRIINDWFFHWTQIGDLRVTPSWSCVIFGLVGWISETSANDTGRKKTYVNAQYGYRVEKLGHAKLILFLTSVEHGKQRSCAGVRSSKGISLLETASLCRWSWWRIERSFGRDQRKPCQICAAARHQDRNKSLGCSADQVHLFFALIV